MEQKVHDTLAGRERAAPANIPAPMPVTGSVSTLMDSSLPPVASGADQYTRQFYQAGRGLPQRRFFPVRGA